MSTLYGGADPIVVLLESVFHDVHHATRDRVVYERLMRELGLVYLRTPRRLRLIDLRDPALAHLGLERHQLVSTSAGHYVCTRAWATFLHSRRIGGVEPEGLVWHSRQAELAGGDPVEVFMLFGDRAPSTPGSYPLTGPGVRNLTEGPGRVLVDEIAEHLNARIEPAGD